MKNKFFSAIVMAFVLVSCNQKGKEDATESHNDHHDSIVTQNDTTTNKAEGADEHAVLYACEMHPEVQGKKDEKCSKCGMKLTEPVAKK